MKHVARILLAQGLFLALTACPGGRPQAIGEHVIYQTVEKEVPRPCPVARPAKPAPLARPLPNDPGALAELLIAKLLEWAGPGGYGDQADAALAICTKPASPPH